MADQVATPANNGIPGAINNPVPGATSIDEQGVARDQSGKILAKNVQTPDQDSTTDQTPAKDPWSIVSTSPNDPWAVVSTKSSAAQPDLVKQGLSQASGLRGPDQTPEDQNPVANYIDKKLHLPSTAQTEQWFRQLGQDIDNGTDQTWVGGMARWLGNHGVTPKFSGLSVGTPVNNIPVANIPGGVAKLGHAIAVGAQGQDVKAFNEAAGATGEILSPLMITQPEALPFIASASSASHAATTVGKKFGLDDDAAEAVGTVVGLIAGGRTVAKGEVDALGTAANRSAAANTVYDARAKEVEIARRYSEATQKAVDDARAAEQAGKGDPNKTIQAQNTASEAASNVRKAQSALDDAEEAKRQAAVEVTRNSKSILRKAKDADASSKPTQQKNQDIRNAFPPSKATPYDETDIERTNGYLEHQHKNVEAIGSTQDLYDAYEASRQDVEDKVRGAIGGIADRPFDTDIRQKVAEEMGQNTSVKNYTQKGLDYLENNYNLDDMNIGQADRLRAQLNAELRGTLKEKKWSVGDAIAKDPEFAAKKYAADALRDGIYDQMDDLGIKNADVMRQDEASLIRMRDAVESKLYKNGQKVRGSGTTPWKSTAAKSAGAILGGSAGALIGGGLGAAIGLGREGAEFGGYFGGKYGGELGQKIAPGDLTRDQMAARIAENTRESIPPTQIDQPAAYPPIQGQPRDFTPLHTELSTHYGEPIGRTPYNDLQNRFMDEIANKQQHGVPLESSEKNLLAKLNEQQAKEMWDAHQTAQEKSVMQEQPFEPTLPKNHEPSQEIEGSLQPGMDTNSGLVHDLAHKIVADELLGNKLPSAGIRAGSHAENMAAGSLASAAFDWSKYIDEDGNFDMKKVKQDIAPITAMYVAGGVANELYHGIPFTENHHLGADIGIIRKLMGAVGLTPAEQVEMIQQAGEHAAEILSRPGVRETLEAHANVREPGLDKDMHMSPERIQQVIDDVKGATNGAGISKQLESPNGPTENGGPVRETTETSGNGGRRPGKSAGKSRQPGSAVQDRVAEGNGEASKGNAADEEGQTPKPSERPENPKLDAELTHVQTEKGGEVRLDSEQEGLKKNRALLKYTKTGDNEYAVTAINRDKDFRGQGIGQQMYERAAQEVRQRGGKTLTSDLQGQTSMDAAKTWDRLSAAHPGEIEKFANKPGSPGYRWDLEKTGTANDRPQVKYKPSEKAATLSAERPNYGPEFDAAQQQHEIDRNKAILRNPRATAEDRRVAMENLVHVQNPDLAAARQGTFSAEDSGLKRTSTGNPEHDRMIEAAGAIPAGNLMGETPLYHDPATGSTLASKASEISEQQVRDNMAKSRASFAPARAVEEAQRSGGFSFNPKDGSVPKDGFMVETHLDRGRDLGHPPTSDEIKQYIADNKDVLDQNPNLHIGGWGNTLGISERIPDEATAKKAGVDRNQIAIWDVKNGKEIPTGGTGKIVPENPKLGGAQVLENLKQQHGESDDAAGVTGGASFITPEGKFIHLKGGMQHPEAIAQAGGAPINEGGPDTRPEFMKESGAIRTRFRNNQAGKSLGVSVPPQGVTPEQVGSLKQAVGQGLGRYGNLTMERSDISPATADKYSQSKEFPTPEHVEPMLRKMGVHPDQIQPENPKLDRGDRVSTRTPEGKGVTEKHLEGEPLIVNTAAMPDKMKAKIADTIREYPGFKIPKNLKDPNKIIKAYTDQFADNLKWLYNQVPKEQQEANGKWYESANKLVSNMADKDNLSKPQAAAIVSALSPGVDWNINVSLAQRLTDALGKSDQLAFTPEMDSKATELINRGTNDVIKKYVDGLRGKKYSDLKDTTDKAVFLRLHDEAHNPREYHDIDPATGESRGLVTNVGGGNAKAGWVSGINPIEKAVTLHEDPSPENISKQLGTAHKIRNFYNNIIDPTNNQDVTIDTHAVGAGHLMPFSRMADPVLDNFGAAGKNKGSGLSGTYPVNADAYRQAAKDLGILPRELQSVTWEKIRDMFPPEWKNEENLKKVQGIWKKFTDGKQSIDDTRQEVLALSNEAKAETQVLRDKQAAKKKSGGERINVLDFLKALGQNKVAETKPRVDALGRPWGGNNEPVKPAGALSALQGKF